MVKSLSELAERYDTNSSTVKALAACGGVPLQRVHGRLFVVAEPDLPRLDEIFAATRLALKACGDESARI